MFNEFIVNWIAIVLSGGLIVRSVMAEQRFKNALTSVAITIGIMGNAHGTVSNWVRQ
ncbi:hypothetical protein D3C84_1095210 [compost metagenome]